MTFELGREKMSRRQESRIKGFTLVELLVVISIIAILLAVLMPALSKARAQATSVICKTRLKDIGSMLAVYANDYPDKLPDSQLDTCRWMHKLAPYYKLNKGAYTKTGVYSWTIFRCPTQEKYAFTELAIKDYILGARGLYGYNIFFSAENNAPYLMWRKITSVRNPGTVPLFGDIDGENDPKLGPSNICGGMFYGGLRNVFPHFSALKYGWKYKTYVSNLGPAFVHRGKMNHLMADFHCETFGINDWEFVTKLSSTGMPGWANIFHPLHNVAILPPTRDNRVDELN